MIASRSLLPMWSRMVSTDASEQEANKHLQRLSVDQYYSKRRRLENSLSFGSRSFSNARIAKKAKIAQPPLCAVAFIAHLLQPLNRLIPSSFPLQPSPMTEASRSLLPSLRFRILSSFPPPLSPFNILGRWREVIE